MSDEIEDVQVTAADMADPEFRALVRIELQAMLMAEAAEADAQLQKLAAFNHANPTQRAIDGVGRHEMSMPAMLYHWYKHVEKLDFSSPKDREWLMQRYPGIRMPGRQTTKLQVGFTRTTTGNVFERNVRHSFKPDTTTTSDSGGKAIEVTWRQ